MFYIKNSMRLIGLFLLVFFVAPNVWTQSGGYFGQNKVMYKKFDWQVFRTDHFDVYYYPEEKEAAFNGARMAERGYDYLSKVLDYQIKERVPLILYASLTDFQQTNVVSGMIGDGTRGVTEGLKNRVTLPFTGSYREFNHVLVHELVHAFQFDIMLHSQYKNTHFNPPLWFVEGMAEYLSAGMDNTTRMWVRDGLLNDKLLTVDQLNSTMDIRVYRLGQSLWHYIGENFGKEMVGNLFKSAVKSGDIKITIKRLLKMKPEDLTNAWHEHAKKLVLSSDSTLASPEQVAEKITKQESYFHRMNIVPSVSPDGNQVVYIANKDLNDDIFLLSKNENGQLEDQRLVKGGKNNSFESLRFFDSSIGWSRDGSQIAFVSKSGKDDVLYIMEPSTKIILKSFTFDHLSAMLSPSFSPNGKEVTFVGLSNGISDLYILDLSSGNLKRLTEDVFTTLHPQWSPDGKSIVFITDRGPGTDEKNLLFGDYDLAIYNLESNNIELITELDGNVSSPQWSPNGSEIAFISDHQGIPNVYKIRLENKKITPFLILQNGVSGITETTPALSWSANGDVLVFSAFEKNSWQLYRLSLHNSQFVLNSRSKKIKHKSSNIILFDDLNELVDVSKDSLLVPDISDPNTIFSEYELAKEDSIEQKNYRSKFKLDGVSVGGGYDTYWGATGQAVLFFSDMLGNHNFYLTSAMQFSDPRHSDFGAMYFNQGKRINYGIQAYQVNALYGIGYDFFSTRYLRNTYRGFNSIVSYPFNKFARIELSAGLTWVDQDIVQETFQINSVERESVDLNGFNYAQVGGALVFDNTVYGPLGPASGSRSRFSLETTSRDFQFTNLFVDYRRYFNVNSRTFLAWRLIAGTSFGKDEQYFVIGGPYTYRGADYNSIVGSNLLISNLEYRFPMFPFLPAKYDWLSAAAFLDAASAWGMDAPGFGKKTFQPFTTDNGFHLKDLNSALGLSARLNLGYFLLQFDAAWPTDLQSFGDRRTMFSLNTFF